MQKSTKAQLGRIQRMACLAIIGAMKSTSTAAKEMLLNPTPLELLIMAEVRMALYRLHTSRCNGELTDLPSLELYSLIVCIKVQLTNILSDSNNLW
jgi:hypothetical protein